MDSGNSLFNNEVQELLNKLKQWDFSNVSGSMDFSGLDEEQPGEARELLLFAKQLHRLLSNFKNGMHTIDEQSEHIYQTFNERADAARQIMNSNENIAKGAAHQAESAEQCAELVNRFQEKFELLRQSSLQMAEKAGITNKTCDQGEKITQELLARNRETQELLMQVFDRMAALEDVVQGIVEIVDFIVEISKQTNLLALNASIEAARAGEAGKGFAVVAQEMNKLSNETKDAAKEIESNIGSIMEEINSIQTLSHKAKDEFMKQDQAISTTNKAVGQIRAALDDFVSQQMRVSDEVEQLMTYKDQLVASINDIAAVTNESAAISQMVATLSMEQTNVDGLIGDMLISLRENIAELNQHLDNINIEEKAIEKKRVAFIALEQQEFYNEVEEAAVNTGNKLNMEVLCKTPERFNVDEQMAIFREFMEQEVDGIILVPGDSERFKDLIDEAAGRGIKVACVDMDVPGSRRNLFVTSDSYEGGRLAGEAAVRHLKGKGNVMVLLCASEVEAVKKRYQGFIDVTGRYPDIKIIRKEEQVDTDIGRTKRILENMIRENPSFDLLYLVNSDAGEIALDLWKARNLDKKLIVLSKSSKVTEGVKEGIVSSQIVQRNALWGEMAVRLIGKLLQGSEADEMVDTGMYEINASNYHIFDMHNK